MGALVKIEEYKVSPNIPKARGMRVLGVIPDFEYKNKLQNAYGQNIAKDEGIDPAVRDLIARALTEEDGDNWNPQYYPKAATIEETDVDGIFNQLTGFTTRSGHIQAKKETMLVYLVEFFEDADEDGVIQSAEYWKRAWRSKENIEEEFDYIKSDYKKENIHIAASDLLQKSAYKPKDNGVYLRKNIAAVLKSLGIKHPSDKWINDVREKINPSIGVMTNADYFPIKDNPKLKDSVIVTTKTYGGMTDPKMDSQTIDAIQNEIFNNSEIIKDKLKNKETFDITVVGRTTGVLLENASKVRKEKTKIIKSGLQKRISDARVIIDLIDNHGLDLDEAVKTAWCGQKPDETEGQLYD